MLVYSALSLVKVCLINHYENKGMI